MKNYSRIILIGLFFGNLNLLSSPLGSNYPGELNEKFILFTDRNYYAVNEKVYFKAVNNSNPLVKEKNWSKVLYVELLNNNGIAAFKGKYSLSASGANGSFVIPSDLASGNYYLMAYTKWMRNFSPLDFAFMKMCVINPEKPFMNKSRKDSSTVKGHGTDLKTSSNNVKCILTKSTFSKREAVTVTLKFPESSDILPNSYCLTIVKKEAINPVDYGIISDGISVSNISNKNAYIPELYGMTVSGSIVEAEDSIPKPNTIVQLSVLGNNFDYFRTKTGADGKFVFSIQPTCNKNEMFISFENDKSQSAKLLIDPEYFPGTLTFRNDPFLSSEDELNLAREIMFNMQVNKLYNSPDTGYPCKYTNTGNFYGSPSKRIYIKDYIELPSLMEVFTELMPEVLVLKKKKETYLQVTGRIENNPFFTIFKPLVLLDRIPVSDIDGLLSMSPKNIKYIDLVSEIYVKGENMYGGIISIYSEKGDLGGFKLPENSIFFNYDGFTPINEKPSFMTENKPNVPDYRNTLYWEPDIIAKPGNEARIKFYTSDVAGEYIVLVRGLSETGEIISGSTDFRVE